MARAAGLAGGRTGTRRSRGLLREVRVPARRGDFPSGRPAVGASGAGRGPVKRYAGTPRAGASPAGSSASPLAPSPGPGPRGPTRREGDRGPRDARVRPEMGSPRGTTDDGAAWVDGRRWRADAMPQVVGTHGRDGVPTGFTRRSTESTGLDLAESLRVGAHTLVHPDDVPEVKRRDDSTRARDGAWRGHAARIIARRQPHPTIGRPTSPAARGADASSRESRRGASAVRG